jgi:hypothetical protein
MFLGRRRVFRELLVLVVFRDKPWIERRHKQKATKAGEADAHGEYRSKSGLTSNDRRTMQP